MAELLIDSQPLISLHLETSDSPGKITIRGQFARSDRATENKRLYREGLWRREFGRLSEAIEHRRMFGELDHPCLTDSDFRVLTADGWKPFVDVQVGDRIWSRVDGKAILSRVEGITNEPYAGVAVRVRGRSIDSGFTPNHKFLTVYRPGESDGDRQIYATVTEICENPAKYGHSAIPRTALWNAEDIREVRIPGVQGAGRSRNDVSQDLALDAKVFSAFMGLYLSEGSCSADSTDNYDIHIHQKTPWLRDFMWNEVLSKMPPELAWRKIDSGFVFSDQRLYRYLKPIGDAYAKRVPAEIKRLGADCLRELIFWFTMGDGRLVESGPSGVDRVGDVTFKEAAAARLRSGQVVYGRQDVFSVSKGLIDDLHECLVKTGGCGSIQCIDPVDDYQFAGRTIRAEDKVPLHQLHVSSAKQIWIDPRWLKLEAFEHKGNVYCLTVTHGNFYMEQRGHAFWTGNSDGRTKLSRVSHIITRLDIKGNEVIGEAEVLDTPNGRIMKALAAANAQVGVSSRGFGSTKTLPDGTLEVQEDFRLDTFDFVADPATKTAYPKVFAEERERMFQGDDMTIEDLKRNYPGLVEELSKNILAESGGQHISRVITETEERTTKRLTEQFGVQIRRATEVLEDEIASQVRSELMSDPSVAGAKLVVEQIVGLVKSYGIDPQAREDLAQKDEEIESLKRRLADRELEAQKLTTEANELRKLSKEAAYKLHLERLIGNDKAKETIEALLGDVTAFNSAEEITRRVEAVKSELDKRGVYKEDEQADEVAELSNKLAAAESEAGRLRSKVEELETSKKSARERATQAEANARKAVEAAEGLELKLHVEQRLATLPEENRSSIRSLCESATDQDEVDRIIANHKPQRRIDEDEAQRIRARVGKGKVRDLNEDTNGAGGNGKNGRGNPLTEIGLNQEDYSRLTGAGRRPASKS